MFIKKSKVKTMIKSLRYPLFVLAFFSLFSTGAYAVKHVVNVQNYAFVPANLTVQVGDTIRWVWINGSHTTTSTTIPAGALAWDEPINSTNTFYEYRVTTTGVYNYLCTPHSSIQIASFTATAPPPPTLSVTPANQNVGAQSGSTNFSVSSNSSWTVQSNAGWCTVTPSGSGNGTIVANYQANTSTSQRVANITVTVSGIPSVTVTVTQSGAAATLTVTPANRDVTSAAGTTDFTVTSNSAWTASSNAGWCTVTSAGSGNGTIVANYQANTSTTQRIATITVSVTGLPNSTVTVTQAGVPPPTLSVTPSNRTVIAAAGSTTFNITSNSNWTASSNSPWCTVPSSGTGNAVLTATYEANTSTIQRTAVITVSVSGIPSVAVTVSQEGAATVLIVDPQNQNVTAVAGSTMFTVTSNTNWQVTSNSAWALPTADGIGNGMLEVTYDENMSNAVRVAVLTVQASGALQEITVTQEGSVSVIENTLSGIKIYPNPTKGQLFITSDKTGNYSMQLLDLKGNIYINSAMNSLSATKLDLSNFAKGTYVLRLDQDGKTYTSQIVLTE